MAIVQDTEMIEEEQQGLDQPKLGGGESSELAQGVGAGAGTQAAGQSTDRRGTQAGNRLRNLQKYVQAGQKSGMAQKIQSGMEDIRSGVETGIQESQQQLGQAAEAERGRITKGEELIKASQEGGTGLFEQGRTAGFTQDISPQTQQIQTPELGTGTDGIAPQPEAVPAPDFSQYGATAAERLGEFQKYKAGEREQLEIQNQQKLQQDIGELQKRADLAKSEKGRFQLLREQFGRPGYTTGQQRLDQLILQASPEQSQVLQEMTTGIATPLQEQFAGLQEYLQTEQGQLDTQAQALAANIGQQLYGEAGQPVIDPQTGQVTDVGGVLGEFRTDLEGRVSEAQQAAQQQFSAITDMIERGYDIDPGVLTRLGISDPEQQQQFIDYYQRGQGRTLGTAIEQGGMDIDELRKVAEMTGTNYEDMKRLYTGTPLSRQEFATAANASINEPDFESRYSNYVSSVAGQSEEYRQQLNDYINQNLTDLRVKGPQIDYSKYLRDLPEGAISTANVATAEDYARQAALEQLANLQFGPLQQGGIGQAGTAGEAGYGRFDIGAALGEARGLYETPTYNEFDRVTAPTLEEPLTLGQISQRELEAGTGAVADELTGALDQVGVGQIAEAGIIDPTKTFVDESGKAITEPMTDVELGAGRIMEGDVLGGTTQIGLSPTTGAVSAATAPVSGLESTITGDARVADLSTDYTEALRGLSYGDFDATSDAVGGTLQMPEQVTRDAVAKVNKIADEAVSAAKSAWKKVSGGGGSFFCTHVYNLGLVSKTEYLKLNKFLHEIKSDYTEFLSWYIDNAPKIIELAGDFDWNIAKTELFDNLLEKYENGDIEGAVRCYGEFTINLGEIVGIRCSSKYYNTENSELYKDKVLKYYGDK